MDGISFLFHLKLACHLVVRDLAKQLVVIGKIYKEKKKESFSEA